MRVLIVSQLSKKYSLCLDRNILLPVGTWLPKGGQLPVCKAARLKKQSLGRRETLLASSRLRRCI